MNNEYEYIEDSSSIGVKAIESITGGGLYRVDLDKNQMWLSENCSKMFNAGGNSIKISLDDHVKSVSTSKLLINGQYIDMREIGDFYDIYKLRGVTEDKKDSFESVVNTPYGNIYIKNAYNVYVKDKKPAYIEGLIFDVTEEFKAKETTLKLTKSLKVGNISNWEYDVEKDQVWVSKNVADGMNLPGANINGLILNKAQYCKLYENMTFTTKDGLKRFEDYGFDFFEMWSIDEYNSDKKYVIEYYFDLNGQRIYNASIGSLIIVDGKVVKMIGISHNITNYKQKEVELKKAYEKLKMAEEINETGSWEIDFIKETIWCSSYTAKINGIKTDNHIKMELMQFAKLSAGMKKSIRRKDGIEYRNFTELLKLFIQEGKKDGDIYTLEYEVIQESGEVDYWKSVIKINFQGGKLHKLHVTSSNITVEKLKEHELIKAIEVAEAATSQQSRFVANMSHEIRTPLNAILGYAEIMKEQNSDKKMDTYLKSIDTAGNSLLSLVNDILDYSKVKANKFTATYIPALIGGFCEELKVLFYHKISRKNLDFDIIYDTDLPTFMLPVATIRQVMINILGNASKFTHEGSIILKAKAKENESGKYDIDISVRDTGIGIPKDKLDSIFKEFEQADTSHEKEGTGLGLALSLNFAKLVGGRVSVESLVGEGSIFTLHLKDIGIASDEMQLQHNSGMNDKIKFFGQRALILDDIADNREVLLAHCDHLNLESKAFEEGSHALKSLDGFKPDIILTDLRMPSMDGEEFAKNVRALDDFKSIPIICITASINPEENYHLENFNDVLNKPIGSHKLSATLSKYLKFDTIVADASLEQEFNLQTAFRNLTMKDEEFERFKKNIYGDIVKMKTAFNPKKVKEVAEALEIFANDTDNKELKEIVVHLEEYCDALDVSNIIECVILINKFIETR